MANGLREVELGMSFEDYGFGEHACSYTMNTTSEKININLNQDFQNLMP